MRRANARLRFKNGAGEGAMRGATTKGKAKLHPSKTSRGKQAAATNPSAEGINQQSRLR